MAKPKPPVVKTVKANKERLYLSQADVPAYSLVKALKIPQSIRENYGNGPAKPLEVAQALNVAPTSSNFKMLAGASIAYGLTEGGWNAGQIVLTALANKILKPKEETHPLEGKREALLKPRVIREFLIKYNDNAVPREDIALNVLEDLGVPKDRTVEVLALIMEGAASVGFISDIKGKKYVNLQSTTAPEPTSDDTPDDLREDDVPANEPDIPLPPSPPTASDVRLTRVFISHGKNRVFIDPIRELLKFGQLDAVVSTEKSTVSPPVTQKVMQDMRSCGAAIIHVDSERKLMDVETKEHAALNENVLIEIGAAMALYGERFILLVKDGVKLPSNLQGLFEVRYIGEKLDGNETIKLMGSINDMKTKPLPT
jgi:predicted nucleotide-binding protein